MRIAIALSSSLVIALLGCTQNHNTLRVRSLELAPDALQQHGIAFITPSTVTGQEQ